MAFRKNHKPWNKGLLGFMAKEKNAKWKGGKPKCLDCGIQLGKYGAKRCNKCTGIIKRGINHPNWKGGISKDSHSLTNPQYKEWRSKVFERDNWTCQTCGERGCYLEPHHIKGWAKYPELRFELTNGVTLCQECHKLTDNYRGKK